MARILILHAAGEAPVARALAGALRRSGYAVWDPEAHERGGDADERAQRLRASGAVVALWSAAALESHWVRAEAEAARGAGRLIQLNCDGCVVPLPFGLYPVLELGGWSGEGDPPGWRQITAGIDGLLGSREAAAPPAPVESAVSAPPKEILLAVLPFENLSNDPELGYFSDGVSEEVLYTVAGIKGLRVIGRTSSFRFRGQDKSVRTVAAALGVTHVLDGSVRRAGDRLRIHVELVDAGSLAMLFSRRLDRPLTDVFALQDEIAAAVAAALDQHFAPLRPAAAVDPGAYDLYLQARAVYAKDLDWAAQAKSVDLLEEAVSRDPDFAQAWGLLGLYRRGDAALEAARRALELDGDCATALMAMAFTKPPFAQHGEKLELARRAYELAPDEQIVAGAYVLLLVSAGLVGQALAVSALRVARDPLSPLIAGGHAAVLRALGRGAEATALAERTVAAFPEAGYARFMQGLLAIFDGDIGRAKAVVEAASAAGHSLPLEMVVMFMEAVAGMDAETRRMVIGQFLTRLAPTSFIVDIGVAAAMGETDLAYEHLLATVREGRPLEFTAENDGRAGGNDIAITSGLFLPNGEALRRDPRFGEVCVRLKLYECWRARDEWPDCVAEVAPLYDLKAECERVAARLG